MERYFTPAEAAENLGFDRRTIYNWIRAGKLPAVKIGHCWRIDGSTLEAIRAHGMNA